MKVIVVGATGNIGGMIMRYIMGRDEVKHVVALTRKPLTVDDKNPHHQSQKLQNIIVPDFGSLETIEDASWQQMHDADALIWAAGTYTLDELVNLKYPLASQETFAVKRLLHLSKHEGAERRDKKLKFILLSGALVEPDQTTWLYFLPAQRRIKGMLQTKTIDFAKAHCDEGWEAIIIRPGGVLFGGNTLLNSTMERLLGVGLAIRAEELGACVADLVVSDFQNTVVGNEEMIRRGRQALQARF